MREESKSYAREAMDIVEHAAHKIGSRLPGSDGEIKFHQYMGATSALSLRRRSSPFHPVPVSAVCPMPVGPA